MSLPVSRARLPLASLTHPASVGEAALIAFGVWTLCCNAAYALGWSLMAATGAALVAVPLLFVLRARLAVPADAPLSSPAIPFRRVMAWAGAAALSLSGGLFWLPPTWDHLIPVKTPLGGALQVESLYMERQGDWFLVSPVITQTQTLDAPILTPIELQVTPRDPAQLGLSNLSRDSRSLQWRVTPPEPIGAWTQPFEFTQAVPMPLDDDRRAEVRLVVWDPVYREAATVTIPVSFEAVKTGVRHMRSRMAVLIATLLMIMLAIMSAKRDRHRLRMHHISKPLLGTLALAVAVAYALTNAYDALFCGVLGVLLLSAARFDAGAVESGPARDDGRARAVVWALALMVALIALFVHRPTFDDAYYLNRAAVLAANFTSAMPAHYTLFPGVDTPLPYPTYPLIAWHDLTALAAVLTGLEPIAAAAYLMAPLGALWMVLAYAALFRLLLPQAWPMAVAVVTALLLIDGSGALLFPQEGIPRAWVGKSVLLHAGIPLAIVFAWRAGRTGGPRAVVDLALALVALCGLSSTAIWLGPAAAGIASVAGAWSAGRVTRLWLIAPALAYPLAQGLWARAESAQAYAYRAGETPNFFALDDAAFGSPAVAAVWYAVLMLAPLLAPTARARLVCGAFALAVWISFANPLTASWIAEHLTSPAVFMRYKHLLLLPVAAGALACWGYGRNPSSRFGPALACILVAVYALAVPTRYLLTSANGVEWDWPRPKVRAQALPALEALVEQAEPGSVIMAPDGLSPYIGAFRKPLYAIAPRENVIRHTVLHQLGDAEGYALRQWSLLAASGLVPLEAERLAAVIEAFEPGVIVLAPTTELRSDCRQFLLEQGYDSQDFGSLHMWRR